MKHISWPNVNGFFRKAKRKRNLLLNPKLNPRLSLTFVSLYQTAFQQNFQFYYMLNVLFLFYFTVRRWLKPCSKVPNQTLWSRPDRPSPTSWSDTGSASTPTSERLKHREIKTLKLWAGSAFTWKNLETERHLFGFDLTPNELIVCVWSAAVVQLHLKS